MCVVMALPAPPPPRIIPLFLVIISSSCDTKKKLYLDLDMGKQNREYDRVKKEFNLDDVQIFMVRFFREVRGAAVTSATLHTTAAGCVEPFSVSVL